MAEDPRQVLQRNRVLLEAAEREQLLEKLPQGHASGLDADTVDGLHAAEIISKREGRQLIPSGGGTAVHGNEKHSPPMAEVAHTHMESQITNLNHDAQKIKGKAVDPSAIANGRVLAYDQPSDKIVYKDPSAGGLEIHGNEFHDPDFATEAALSTHEGKTTSVHNFDGEGKAPPQSHSHPCSELIDHTKAMHDGLGINAAALEGSTKAQVQDHAPKAHSHPCSELTDHTKATHDALGINAAALEGSTKAQVQDHTPKEHGNEAHNPDFSQVGHTHPESEVTFNPTTGHDHNTTGSKQVDHANLANKGTNTHTQIDTHLAAAAPHSGHEQTANKNVANGYCGLDASALIALARIPRLDLTKIPLGSSGYFLKGQGVSDSIYALLAAGDIPNLDAAKIASGIFDQARIPWSSIPAGGLTIGADANIYRSAADIHKTDDRFDSLMAFLTGAGTDPGTLADGLLWHRTDLGLLFNRLKGVSGSLVSILKKLISVSTVTATTSETAFSNCTLTLPANFLQVGKAIRIKVWGIMSSSASAVSQRVRCRYGGVSGTILADTGAVTVANSLANALVVIDIIITCITTGSSGTVEVQAMITWNSNTAPANRGMGTGATGAGNSATITINTTTQNDLVITIVFGGTTSGNSMSIRAGTIEVE